MTPKQRQRRFAALTDMGCIVCLNQGRGWVPPEIHHLKGSPWSGMGKKEDDANTIPLYPGHHRYGGDGEIGFHQSPAEFRERYGSQGDLYAQVEERLD